MWLFLTVPCVGLQCVIMVFPDHTYLLLGVIYLYKQLLNISHSGSAKASVFCITFTSISSGPLTLIAFKHFIFFTTSRTVSEP